MCVLVDANLASLVFSRPALADFEPLLDWLLNPDRDGRLVLGGLLARELGRVEAARRVVAELLRSGRARRIEDARVSEAAGELKDGGLCRSNDHHVIALALVSGARVLCTRDRTLQEDFRNADLVTKPRGNIYQRREHGHLLRHSRSCGFLRVGKPRMKRKSEPKGR